VISPSGPPATQNIDDGHEMTDAPHALPAISNLVQLDRRAAGAVETTAPPASSTATHSATVGQEIAVSDCEKWY
jgi:hypothetical protein